MPIHAFAADKPKGDLKPFTFEPGPLGDEDIEIAVSHCGICHSDLSMLDNEWGMTAYPFVPGHEVVGKVAQIGKAVTSVKVGDRVGLGWFAKSCMTCRQCMSGNHNLCATAQATIIGRHGGFANKVRAHSGWVLPLPKSLDAAKSGPLFCGGVTVFNPLIEFDIRPTHRVGVVGIGGLGHMALKILNKWGCEVVAFSSTAGKSAELTELGAHRIVNSRDDSAMKALTGTLDFILVTVNVTLNWAIYISLLAPKGRLHFVGAVLEPVPVAIFPMIDKEKSLGGSPLGSPSTTSSMLDFCARHKIEPITEMYPMSKVNDAIAHLRAGKARYRIVLVNDLAE